MTAEGEAGPAAAADAATVAETVQDAPVPDAPGAGTASAGMEGTGAENAGLAGAGTASTEAAHRVADGIACLEQAIAAFTEAAESGAADIVPLAVELLARTLPLCERDEESAEVWQHGLEHPDPAIAEAVRERLRRAFGSDEATAEPPWWEGFVESAVCHGTLPLLTNEVFGALDHMYALAAVPLARGGARTRELREVLAQAVRVPGEYVWGAYLLASFRERFRDLTGTETETFDG